MHPVNFEGAIEIKKPENMTDEQCMSISAKYGFFKYYVGQKFLTKDRQVVVIDQIDLSGQWKLWARRNNPANADFFKDNNLFGKGFYVSECRPILRPLSDMTEDECFSVISLNTSYPVLPETRTSERFISYRLHYGNRRSIIKHEFFPVNPRTPAAMDYLIKQGFDLFGLLESDLAVCATIVK